MRRLIYALYALFCLISIESARAEALLPIVPSDPYLTAMGALSEGRIDDARAALALLVASNPDSPGALLDLATLRCSLGDAEEAEKLFEEIKTRFSPPDAIVEVINQQRATGCLGRESQWLARVRFGRGYDSNANQGVSNPYFSIGSGINRVDLVVLPAFQPIGDQYSALSAEYFGESSLLNQTNIFVLFRARQYDNLSYVDTASLLAGAERAWRFGDWRLRGTASFGSTLLGGHPYLNQTQLQMQAQPPINFPAGWHFMLTGGWSNLSYPSYPAYNGNVFEARSSLRLLQGYGLWQANIGALYDKEVNQRPGGDRQGYFASIDGRMNLPQGLVAELGWQHLQWQARDEYSPGLIDTRRKQDIQAFRAGISIPVTTKNSILAEYQYTDNRENISLFQYKGQSIQISWQYSLGQ